MMYYSYKYNVVIGTTASYNLQSLCNNRYRDMYRYRYTGTGIGTTGIGIQVYKYRYRYRYRCTGTGTGIGTVKHEIFACM